MLPTVGNWRWIRTSTKLYDMYRVIEINKKTEIHSINIFLNVHRCIWNINKYISDLKCIFWLGSTYILINYVSTRVPIFSLDIAFISSTLFILFEFGPFRIFELVFVWLSFTHWIPSSLSEDCWLFPSILSWYSYDYRKKIISNLIRILGKR